MMKESPHYERYVDAPTMNEQEFKTLTWDRRISAGNLLTLLGMAAAAAVAYSNLNGDILAASSAADLNTVRIEGVSRELERQDASAQAFERQVLQQLNRIEEKLDRKVDKE